MACQIASPRGEHSTPRRGTLFSKVKLCFFQPAGRFHDGLARPISAPLGLADGESTADPPVASLALAPWPARRAFKVQKIKSVWRVAPPAPRGRAGDVKPALRQSSSKRKVQSISYVYPMNSNLLYDSSIKTPHACENYTHPCALTTCYCGAHKVAAGT